MAFLTINGAAIPVVDFEEQFSEIGDSGRAFDGTMSRVRRAVKRTWQVTTPTLSYAEAENLEALLAGYAEAWAFDYLSKPQFSSKGVKSSASAEPGIFTIRSKGADGMPILGGAKYGGGIQAAATYTNLLTANQASIETDTTGFAALATATISRNTSFFWYGASSLRTVCAAPSDGFRTTGTAAGTTGAVRGNVWIMATTAVTVTAWLRNATTATDGATTVIALSAYTWTKFDLDNIAHGGAELIEIRATAGAACTFYADGLMIDTNTTGSSVPWQTGTQATATPIWPLAGSDDFTMSFWATAPEASATKRAVTLADVTSTVFAGVIVTSTLASFTFTTSAGTETTSTTVVWSDATTNKQITITGTKATGVVKIYINGALQVTHTAAATPNWDSATQVNVGHINGSSHSNRMVISDLLIAPWTASATEVLGYYNCGAALAIYPRLWLSGDAIPEGPLMVQASLGNTEFRPSMNGSTFDKASRSVSFVLEEI